jgi:uncharacterized protein YfaP (DUF2135 family)
MLDIIIINDINATSNNFNRPFEYTSFSNNQNKYNSIGEIEYRDQYWVIEQDSNIETKILIFQTWPKILNTD